MSKDRTAYIRKLISAVEKQFELDLDIRQVHTLNSLSTNGQYLRLRNGGGCIKINDKLRGRRLKEVVYHELGHALWDKYRLPLSLIKLFARCKPSRYDRSLIRSDGFAGETGKENFHVTHYAQMNKEEDFSETLAVVLMCKLKVPTRLRYGLVDDCLDDIVRITPPIRKKVKALIEFLQSKPQRKVIRRSPLSLDELLRLHG